MRAGLWEREARLLQFKEIDFNEVYRLAEEQSVIGLVAAGLDHVKDIKAPKEIVLQFVGTAEENEDALVIFTHFIKHFYKGGLGIRQICDWCRLLWTYKETIDLKLLEIRLKTMGLMTEWKAFAAYAVDYLGMPSEAMPLYDGASKWKSKAEKVHAFIIEVGNFGHNIDGGYYRKYPFLIRKTISMCRRMGVLIRHSRIFPWHSIKFMPHVLFTGLSSAAKGE